MFKGYAPVALQNSLSRFPNLPLKDKVHNPVAFQNPLSRFQDLFYLEEENPNWDAELDEFVKSLCQLNDQDPIKLLEFAKDSHCLAFNYTLHQVRTGNFQEIDNFFCDYVEDDRHFYMNQTSENLIKEAIDILGNLKLKDRIKNEESFIIISNLVTIAKEFRNKIQDLEKREKSLTKCEGIAFSVENLAFDYHNCTIDYGSFMAVFYEIKSLYFNKPETGNLRKRLKNLKCLFNIYADLIRKSQCYLIFDFYPVEELFYLITRNERKVFEPKPSFEAIFSCPKEKYCALERLYNSDKRIFKFFGDKVVGKKVNPKNYQLLIRKRFFAKLVNFLKVKENYDQYSVLGTSQLDYCIWVYTGLSKVEYYLNS
jgi:hypothetical protein